MNTICTSAGFNNVGILGPGVSSLQPNTWSYYEALAQNEDGLSSLAAFSTHIWDDAYKVERTLHFVESLNSYISSPLFTHEKLTVANFEWEDHECHPIHVPLGDHKNIAADVFIFWTHDQLCVQTI